jgi:hypothetical protein
MGSLEEIANDQAGKGRGENGEECVKFFRIVVAVFILRTLSGKTIRRTSCENNDIAAPNEVGTVFAFILLFRAYEKTITGR